MSEPMQVVQRHFDAFNAKDGDAEPWSDDAELMAPGAELRGRDQILDWLKGYWEAFPDAKLEIGDPIMSGPVVVAEGRLTGTNEGPMRTPGREVPATGRLVEIRWMARYEVRGEELVSEHLYFDQMEFLGQLGLAKG